VLVVNLRSRCARGLGCIDVFSTYINNTIINTNAMHIIMYEMQNLSSSLEWASHFLNCRRQLDQQCLFGLIAQMHYSLISQSPAASIGLYRQITQCQDEREHTT